MCAAKPGVAFIGTGAMGGPMALRLLAAGYAVSVYDRDAERMAACAANGAQTASSEADAVGRADVVCLSLPSSGACVAVADAVLLPQARRGQIFIDFGTTTPPDTRRIADALREKCGAFWMDAPVSGGTGGAESGRLRIFASGDAAVFERIRPLLETVGGAEHLTYCGPSGHGQIVKGVNQLAMGLGAAAYLEAVAFGVRAGVRAETIAEAVGSDSGEAWRVMVYKMANAAADGSAETVGVKFRELPYFLREATETGRPLPLTQTLYDFCDAGPRVVVDDNRPAPSFWRQLTTGKEEAD